LNFAEGRDGEMEPALMEDEERAMSDVMLRCDRLAA